MDDDNYVSPDLDDEDEDEDEDFDPAVIDAIAEEGAEVADPDILDDEEEEDEDDDDEEGWGIDQDEE